MLTDNDAGTIWKQFISFTSLIYQIILYIYALGSCVWTI